MQGPECVAGRLEEVFHDIWDQSEFKHLAEAGFLTSDEREILLFDFTTAKSHLLAILRQKTAYLKILPWAMMALAHSDESVARSWCVKLIDEF